MATANVTNNYVPDRNSDIERRGGGGDTREFCAIAFKNIILIELPQISMSLVVVQGSIQDEIFDSHL